MIRLLDSIISTTVLAHPKLNPKAEKACRSWALKSAEPFIYPRMGLRYERNAASKAEDFKQMGMQWNRMTVNHTSRGIRLVHSRIYTCSSTSVGIIHVFVYTKLFTALSLLPSPSAFDTILVFRFLFSDLRYNNISVPPWKSHP